MKYAGALILVIFLLCPGVVMCEDEIPNHPIGPVDPQPTGNTWFKPNEPVSLNFDRSKKIKYVKVNWNDVKADVDLGAKGTLYVDNQSYGQKDVGENSTVTWTVNKFAYYMYIIFQTESAQILSYSIEYDASAYNNNYNTNVVPVTTTNPTTGSNWWNVNETFTFYADPNRMISYIQVKWNDNGQNSKGTLFVDSTSYGQQDVGSGTDTDTWTVNRSGNQCRITFQNGSVQLIECNIYYNNNYNPYNPNYNNPNYNPYYNNQYNDPYYNQGKTVTVNTTNTATGTNWYNAGESLFFTLDPTRIVESIKVYWDDQSQDADGRLYIDSTDLGQKDIGNNDTDTWSNINRSGNNGEIKITGDRAQIITCTITYDRQAAPTYYNNNYYPPPPDPNKPGYTVIVTPVEPNNQVENPVTPYGN